MSLLTGMPKMQRIERGNGIGSHGQNIPDNAAHPRGSTLKRGNGRRVVMTLHLEGQHFIIINIHC